MWQAIKTAVFVEAQGASLFPIGGVKLTLCGVSLYELLYELRTDVFVVGADVSR